MGRNQKIAVGALAGTMVLEAALVMLNKLTGPEFTSFAQTFVPTMVGIALGASAVIKGAGAFKGNPAPAAK